MPVGTQATVKTLTPDDLRDIGAQIILGNTYHLYLRPGSDLVDQLGGLHGFMAWDRSILTDSGGFQVFSLGHMRELSEEGVTFRSHLDGSSHHFTPESVVQIQEQLGSDIAMVLDECLPYGATEREARESSERTTRWAQRARATHHSSDQALFGIAQGGMYPRLRRESAEQLIDLDFPGYAIGGLSVGEPKEMFYEMMAVSAQALPVSKPRYLMGVGAPDDLFEAVSNGIDMFDCVLQTRLGRNGALFTRGGRINIRNARFRIDAGPPDPWCDCYTCRTFSLAYLHHLFRAEELLAYRLASLHNLRWTIKLVDEMRAYIQDGTFEKFRTRFLDEYEPPRADEREEQRARWVAARERRSAVADAPVVRNGHHPIFDGHNDVLLRLREGHSFFERGGDGHIDLPRAREGGFGGGFCAIFVRFGERPPVASGPDQVAPPLSEHVPPTPDLAYAQGVVLDVMARLFRLEEESAGQLRVVRTAAEIEDCLQRGVFAALMHVEGAEAIDPNLDSLEVFWRAGLRSIGPVWSRPNIFGHGVPFRFPASPDTGPGLTDLGRDLVRACNRLRIVIDLSHLNEQGFWEVAGLSDAPLIATHSNAHALTPSTRNLTDRQLDAIRESEGVVGVNFAVAFLREDGRLERDTPLDAIVRHVDYLVGRLGIDGVGFGSDFDGAMIPAELGDASGLPRLIDALRAAGYDEPSLRKLAHENWLRVLRKTWGA